MRLRAIACCLFYGVVPSRFYERVPHHGASYWSHLWMNLATAWRWATWREDADDVAFEVETNLPGIEDAIPLFDSATAAVAASMSDEDVRAWKARIDEQMDGWRAYVDTEVYDPARPRTAADVVAMIEQRLPPWPEGKAAAPLSPDDISTEIPKPSD
jgi:hypothetical protein